MARDRLALALSVDRQADVELQGIAPDESSVELVIQRCRDVLWQRPSQHWQPQVLGRRARRVGGCLMIGVAGDSAVVEDEQAVGATANCELFHFTAERGLLDAGQLSVGECAQSNRGDTKKIVQLSANPERTAV